MAKMKYVITKQGGVMTFPSFLSHSEVATKKNVISAGYATIKNGKVHTYGKSHSMGIKSKKGDEALLSHRMQ